MEIIKSLLRIILGVVVLGAICLLVIYTIFPLDPRYSFNLNDGAELFINSDGKSLEGVLKMKSSPLKKYLSKGLKYNLSLESQNTVLIEDVEVSLDQQINADIKNLDKIKKDKFSAILKIKTEKGQILKKDITVNIDKKSPTLKFVRDFKKNDNGEMAGANGIVYRKSNEIDSSITFDEIISSKSELACLDKTLNCQIRVDSNNDGSVIMFKADPSKDNLDVKTHYKVYDLAGNVTEGDLLFKNDNKAPVLTQISLAVIPSSSNFQNYTFKVKANEPLLVLYIRGTQVKPVNGVYSLPIKGLLAGRGYSVAVNAYDYAGNQTYKFFYFRVTSPTPVLPTCESLAKVSCSSAENYNECYAYWYATNTGSCK